MVCKLGSLYASHLSVCHRAYQFWYQPTSLGTIYVSSSSFCSAITGASFLFTTSLDLTFTYLYTVGGSVCRGVYFEFSLAAALPRGHNLPISVSYLHGYSHTSYLSCAPLYLVYIVGAEFFLDRISVNIL